MNITIKPISGKTYVMDVADDETVDELKKRLEPQLNVDHSHIKLMSCGKIMIDGGKKLKEYGVKQNDFVGLMISSVYTFTISIFLERSN